MLLNRFSSFAFEINNWPSAPPASTGFGTSVVPGASDAEGLWTEIATAADVAHDCYWIFIWVSTGFTSTASKQHLLDVGVDPAGGTAYTPRVINAPCGGSTNVNNTGGPQKFLFPLLIPAGSSVAVRIQGSHATAGTVYVAYRMLGQPNRPEQVPIGQYSETVGITTGTLGTSVVPGNGVYGSWASLGTTARNTFWWQLGVQCDNATTAAESLYFELAYGDGSNKRLISRYFFVTLGTENLGDWSSGNFSPSCLTEVPAGETIYCRAACNNPPDTGYNVAAIGIG